MKLTTNHPASSYNIPVFVDGDNNPLDYAEGIKEFRKLKGFKTAADLAERLGVSTRTVQGWEQGRVPSNIALNFMMELLINREGKAMTENNNCSSCLFLDVDRGFCWCSERGATEVDPVFSKVTQQTETEGRPQDEVCEHWQETT